MAATTVIANELRRARRDLDSGADIRGRIAEMRRDALPVREIRAAGLASGSRERVESLADVLYAVQMHGLGRAAVIEESNRHLVLRLHESACCANGAEAAGGCAYVEGFLAGCLLATGRYDQVEVRETECGMRPGASCLFRAECKSKVK